MWEDSLQTPNQTKTRNDTTELPGPILGLHLLDLKKQRQERESPLPKKQFRAHPAASEGMSWYGESSTVMPRGLWISCSLHLHLTSWPQLSQQCFRALLHNSCNWLPELAGESSFKAFWDLQVNGEVAWAAFLHKCMRLLSHKLLSICLLFQRSALLMQAPPAPGLHSKHVSSECFVSLLPQPFLLSLVQERNIALKVLLYHGTFPYLLTACKEFRNQP